MPVNPTPGTLTSSGRAPLVQAEEVGVLLGGLPILRDLTFSIEAGELVALMGGNGSGKTTLVRTLLGLLPHQHGSIRLFGREIEQFREWWRVGYVPQRGSVSIHQATVNEVVASGRLARKAPLVPPNRHDRAAAKEALDLVGLADRAADAFADLSGGQQQRILIARALAGDAQFLLLDEPLAGVDLRTQERLAQLVGDLNRGGLTAIIVLHELGPFEGMLSRAIVLREGRIVSDGPAPTGHPHGHEVVPQERASLVRGVMDGRN